MSSSIMAQGKGSTFKDFRHPEKNYIPILIRTNALYTDEVVLNASYMSIEDITLKNPKIHGKKSNEIEVRYTKNFSRLSDKLKAIYSCDKEACPIMKERLDKHHLKHHNKLSSIVHTESTPIPSSQDETKQCHHPAIKETANKAMITENKQQISVATTPHHLKKSISTQISMSFNRLFNPTINIRGTPGNSNSFSKTKCLRNENSNEDDCTSNVRENLHNEIMKWYYDILIYLNLNVSDLDSNTEILHDFINKVYRITNKDNGFEGKLVSEIDVFLNDLLTWYPSAKRNQVLFKETIKKHLLDTIRALKDADLDRGHIADDYVLSNVGIESVCEDDVLESIFQNEILHWIMELKFKPSHRTASAVEITDIRDMIVKHVIPILNQPINGRMKILLEDRIIDTLTKIKVFLDYPINCGMYFNRFAKELANRLILVKSQHKKGRITSCESISNERKSVVSLKELIPVTSFNVPNKNTYNDKDVIENQISNLESINKMGKIECGIKKKHSFSQAPENVRGILAETINNSEYSILNKCKPRLPIMMSVYSSEHESNNNNNYPVTSTPNKRNTVKTDVEKFDSDESTYMNNVAEVIRTWVQTLPKDFDEDQEFKETAVMNLAADLLDEMKIEQRAPKQNWDRNKILSYIVYRWLIRFDVYEQEFLEDLPQITDLVRRLNEVSIPILRRSQEVMPQITNGKNKNNFNFRSPKISSVTFTDILVDEISVWLNEQPSQIFLPTEKNIRNDMITELAETLSRRISNKTPQRDISVDINKWLMKLVKPTENNKVTNLTENLQCRIINLFHNGTVVQSKTKQNHDGHTSNTEETLKELIFKFMEHNYVVDDTMARDAFGELLKSEFRKYNPYVKMNISTENDTEKPKPSHDVTKARLDKELQYIMIVSDWLKNIPIQSSFNTPQNRERIDFVTDLAKNIYEIEEERKKDPAAIDYDKYIATVITQYIDHLPILPEHNNYAMLIVNELAGEIAAGRKSNLNQTLSSNDSIKAQNISEFLENYINLNARHFADDPLKMDVWLARIIEELKNIAAETSSDACKCDADIIERINEISYPTNESVRIFSLELEYAIEICDWMNNLPLVPISNSDDKEKRIKMISDLSKTISEGDRLNNANPQHSEDLEVYIKHWIRQLPLDPTKEIDMTVLIHQLKKRIEKARTKQDGPSEENGIIAHNVSNKQKDKETNKSRSNATQCKKPLGCHDKSLCCSAKMKHSGNCIIQVIDDWSSKVPIRADTKEAEKNIRDNITIKLLQKIGDLNMSPESSRDPSLFRELLADEVNNQLDNLPPSADIQKCRESLKNDFVNQVMDAKAAVDKSTAGDSYKNQLENTIDVSIPNPISNKQWFDPGFEIYKNRLADLFILENFDHSNDAVKARYEKRIRNELDKYCTNAQKRNIVPINKETINNELMSALFKVPIPHEISTMEEVEEAKTRCEIDTWFSELPIREAISVTESLEWDKILSTLAKKICQIEKLDLKSGDEMHREIKKWLVKFPVSPEKNKSIDSYVEDLKKRLENTEQERKCVKAFAETAKKDKKGKSLKKASVPKSSNAIIGLSQITRPSVQKSQQTTNMNTPKKKSADIILEIVDRWSDSLPFSPNIAQDKNTSRLIKDNLATKIIIKLLELNSSPSIFNDDIIYDYYFDEELDYILSDLPLNCNVNEKNIKKQQLKEAIDSVKPLIREEKARHEYRKELKNTIESILEEPFNTTTDKIAEFNELKDDIVDNFIEYHFNRDDDEKRQIYKKKLSDVVVKYFLDAPNKSNMSVDPLIIQNQLLCELLKVSIPSEEAIKDEVEEIEMKNEVNDFFEGLSLPEESNDKMTARSKVKHRLSKHLHEMEKDGHNKENHLKMNNEIGRCFKKLSLDVAPDKIDAFINKLQDNEALRKSVRIKDAHEESNSKHNFARESNSGKTYWPAPATCHGFTGGISISSTSAQEARKCPEYAQDDQRYYREPAPIVGDSPSNQFDAKPEPNLKNGPRTYLRRSKDENLCKCGRMNQKLKGRLRCVLRMPEICNECSNSIGPMWMPYCCPPPGSFYF